MMNLFQKIILIPFLLLLNSCISEFIPLTNGDKKLLVVEGLITDQPAVNTIKLSKSLPLGTRSLVTPVTGCLVTISDDLGNKFLLTETVEGTYVTNPAEFQGILGRSYTLQITTGVSDNNLNYESLPMVLKPVPPIDSIYYEKVTIQESTGGNQFQQGCQVYLNSHDPNNKTRFYRWEYSETWEFHLPYTAVTNNVCWISNNSNVINIKNTSALNADLIDRYPLIFISSNTDRLNIKYSILVNQYSLNEDEYLYWEKLQGITEEVGSLYDRIPSSIPSNIFCIDSPNEKVLGYFSVSSVSSKRIFIKDRFSGLIDLYTRCEDDTIFDGAPIPNLDISVWIIIKHPIPPPNYNIITYSRGCADCTVRGTKKEPDFWNEKKFP